MRNEFFDWYRTAGIEPSAETLANRWAAIETYAPTPEGVISLVRLFYRIGKQDETFLEAFRLAMKETDPTFSMKGKLQELSFLAGAKLIEIIDKAQPQLSDLACLSLICASAQNLRPNPVIPEIPELASAYLKQRSVGRKSTISANNAENPSKALVDSLLELESPYDQLAAEVQRSQLQYQILSEETNMLWWLFAERSRDSGQKWSIYSVAAASLMAGKELADLTTLLPGPLGAPAFLDRVIQCSAPKPPKSVVIKDGFNQTTIEWRTVYSADTEVVVLADIIPVSRGINISLSAPDNDQWAPLFKSETGISPEAKIQPAGLAYQIFLERLLTRLWKFIN